MTTPARHGSDEEVHYDERTITFLEALWGDGYLSPGGPEEIDRMLDGLDLRGARLLDIGCGSGGITVALARDHGAAAVVGIDVEAPACDHARRRVAAAGLADRIEIRHVDPGPLPLDDDTVDVVFSKDAIVHIADKDMLAREVFRVVRRGGWFVASDWLIAHDGQPSPQMAEYLIAEDLGFGMASPDRYRRALEDAGFVDVVLRNRNAWYLETARLELRQLERLDRARFDAAVGADEVDRQIRTWKAMLPVLESGEHCPHHLRGRRPTG